MNKIWWLWLPIGFMAVQIVLEMTLSQPVLAVMHSENGPHEILQFAIMLLAFAVAVMTLIKMDKKANKPLSGWIGLAALCCLYVAGEEISWGQHLLEWTTPEFWAQVNDQQETNLHNTTSWLDQKPRLLLEIGVVTGGLLIPLLLKYKPKLVPEKFSVIYPPVQLAVIALMVIGIKITDKVAEGLDIMVFERASEVQELYLFYFVLLYLIFLRKRAV